MSAHVLVNLLNELGKKDKMRGSAEHFIVFSNEFNKFNNTETRMRDSIYHMTLNSHFISKFVLKDNDFPLEDPTFLWDVNA